MAGFLVVVSTLAALGAAAFLVYALIAPDAF